MATVTTTHLRSHPDLIAGANGKPTGKAASRRAIGKSRALGEPSPVPVLHKHREAALEREQLLLHARALLEPLASLEMLCEADEKMENVIVYMNRSATETMNLQHGCLNPMLRGADVRSALGIPFTSSTRTRSESVVSFVPWLPGARASTTPN